jgi:hypothetical protein
MIRSLKAAFGLSILAALAMSALSVMSASATDPGPTNHFTSGSSSTVLDIREATGTTHETKLIGWGVTVTCHNITYSAPNVDATETQITVTPSYNNCTSGSNTAHVRMNGCDYLFTAPGAGAHETAHFLCPVGKKAEVEVTGSGSLMKFGTQTTKGGVVYTASSAGGVATLTADITAESIHGECHGLCQFLGTTRTDGKLEGSATIEGTSAGGARVPVAAT